MIGTPALSVSGLTCSAFSLSPERLGYLPCLLNDTAPQTGQPLKPVVRQQGVPSDWQAYWPVGKKEQKVHSDNPFVLPDAALGRSSQVQGFACEEVQAPATTQPFCRGA